MIRHFGEFHSESSRGYNSERDVAPVDPVPQFEYDVNRMLAEGNFGEASQLDFNGLDIDEVGNRVDNVFDAIEAQKAGISRLTEQNTVTANE